MFSFAPLLSFSLESIILLPFPFSQNTSSLSCDKRKQLGQGGFYDASKTSLFIWDQIRFQRSVSNNNNNNQGSVSGPVNNFFNWSVSAILNLIHYFTSADMQVLCSRWRYEPSSELANRHEKEKKKLKCVMRKNHWGLGAFMPCCNYCNDSEVLKACTERLVWSKSD